MNDSEKELELIHKEERLIEMTTSLSQAKKELKEQRDAFAEHFVKCCVWRNSTNDMNNWINTLSLICAYVGKIILKDTNKKLDSSYYSNIFFDVINEPTDFERVFYKININNFKNRHDDLENIEILNYFKLYKQLCEVLLNSFISKNVYKTVYYRMLIENFFEENDIK